MYFDRLAGRPLEADTLTGAIVAAGKRLGIPTPINAALLALLRASSMTEAWDKARFRVCTESRAGP